MISSNHASGVLLNGGTTGDILKSNYIGTDPTGASPRPNTYWGVIVHDSPTNTIGGIGAGNVISGNSQGGVAVYGVHATANVLQGNFIGTNAAGTGGLGNTFSGVYVGTGADFNEPTLGTATNTTIGGTTAGTANVISGNLQAGVWLTGGTTGDLVRGRSHRHQCPRLRCPAECVVGHSHPRFPGQHDRRRHHRGRQHHLRQHAGRRRDLRHSCHPGPGAGQQHRSLRHRGAHSAMAIRACTWAAAPGFGEPSLGIATNDTIGGTAAAARNVISANGNYGVSLNAGTTADLVQGNYIGVDPSGYVARGNAQGGVEVDGGASNNTIGGTVSGARNIISGNTLDGVVFNGVTTTGNKLQGNFIGTTSNGVSALANGGGNGVTLLNSPTNTIGGVAATPGTAAGQPHFGQHGLRGLHHRK